MEAVRTSTLDRQASRRARRHLARAEAASAQAARNVVDLFVQAVRDARDHLAAGGVARGVSVLVMHPVDSIKTRLQAAAPGAGAPIDAVKAFLASGRVFAGVGISLFGQIPYGMLTFGAYEAYKEVLAQKFPAMPSELRVMLGACLGDLTGSLWLCPAERIKQTLQSGVHGSVLEAVRKTYKNGGLPGFYQGYSGQIGRDVPFRIIQLSVYEKIKAMYARAYLKEREAVTTDNLIIGALAGSISSVLTAPLDVIKTRLMTDQGGSARVYKNALDCVVKIVRAEGPGVLARGVVPRVIYITPSVAIFFAVYEATLRFIRNRRAAADPSAATRAASVPAFLLRPIARATHLTAFWDRRRSRVNGAAFGAPMLLPRRRFA
ncbi:S-adenosylmethionine carrier 1, chloroplastic/mitochondrial [Porphyridium purpureum]|uniref:S-adenosylmethionine carrier 1, chloroplastic/mitochondrial n=1 Tax=Porphyridium purpureum TaxID=35688 RepID=A0A5J4YTC7_PORPP|nr:S-adenosylmethionine carrier 1, chloroplastic/mitochondrial [Porphyridium purpureum]|eukprot:POR5757..scf229_5